MGPARRRKIALFLHDASYMRNMALGFNNIAVAQEWLLIIGRGFGSRREEAEISLKNLRDGGCDAIVLTEVSEHVELASTLGVPVVAVGVDLSHLGYPSVMLDNPAAGREAAEHLVGLGLRDFAGFGFSAPWWTERLKAFRTVIEQSGRRYHSGYEDANLLGRSGLPLVNSAELEPWLRSLPKPIGVLAGCDTWGRLLLNTCEEHRIRVPNDVVVIGVDNDELTCETAHPPLSSVAVSWERVGYETAMLLDRIFDGQPHDAVVISVPPTGTVIRRSTDGVAVGDANVSEALAFIHDNAHRQISVPEILRHVPTTRHTLQRAFRRILGRTMVQEIRRVHVRVARRLLVTTDLPVADIAKRSGYPNADKFGKAFRQETGVTPSVYRRQFQIRVN